jgi:hypothetical protein
VSLALCQVVLSWLAPVIYFFQLGPTFEFFYHFTIMPSNYEFINVLNHCSSHLSVTGFTFWRLSLLTREPCGGYFISTPYSRSDFGVFGLYNLEEYLANSRCLVNN